MCAALANKQNLIAGGGDYIFDENAATAAANCNKANTSTKIRNPVLAPKWGPNGAARDLPDHYVIDCAGHNMTSLIPDIVDQAKSIFQQHGVVMLKNTGLATSNEMEVWMTKILTDKMKYEGGANSRRALKDSNVYDTGAPLSANLHYHHEMAYVPNSVASLGFCCVHCPENKGWTWISDQKQSTQYLLATKMGQKLKEKGLCYVRCLTNREAYQGVQKTWNGIDEIGVYNHWQQSFGVETKEECEKKLQALGPQFKWTWGENDYLRTFFYVDTFEYFPGDDTNYLYASLADDAIWFDSWHGVNHLPTMEDPNDSTGLQRPLKLTYGDGTEFTRDELAEFLEVYDLFGYPIKWAPGDIAVICNWRWAHGRPKIELEEGEVRELGVVLGPTFKRVGQKDGCWPGQQGSDKSDNEVDLSTESEADVVEGGC